MTFPSITGEDSRQEPRKCTMCLPVLTLHVGMASYRFSTRSPSCTQGRTVRTELPSSMIMADPIANTFMCSKGACVENFYSRAQVVSPNLPESLNRTPLLRIRLRERHSQSTVMSLFDNDLCFFVVCPLPFFFFIAFRPQGIL